MTEPIDDPTRLTLPPTLVEVHGTGGLRARYTSPLEDLSTDQLLAVAPRIEFEGKAVPGLGGIPLLSRLGRGGMGAVYLGIHPRLDNKVAVKVLTISLSQEHPGLKDRFVREAKIAAMVKSPHLVTVSDINQDSGLFYLVMEFVSGKSAGDYLKAIKGAGNIGVDESIALDICVAATEGLAAAHSAGIIHRDVKPDNILIPNAANSDELHFSAAKLGDLGLAREDHAGNSLTGAGAMMGTPGYMAPEQALDAKTARQPADVFSMGATLYALLSGRVPFQGSTSMNAAMAAINKPHDPINNVRAGISPEISSLLDRCLAKKPNQRYADGNALLAALKLCRMALDGSVQVHVGNTRHTREELRAKILAGQARRKAAQASTAPEIPPKEPSVQIGKLHEMEEVDQTVRDSSPPPEPASDPQAASILLARNGPKREPAFTSPFGVFPFGQPVKTVTQQDRNPKQVFVLGVYSSAVHARWIGSDGTELVKALAVASEPYIFWRGDNADRIVSSIALPKELGRLVPADAKLNGASGIALDDLFLKPLGLTREQTWLCDLVPQSCVNPNQLAAIEREYLPLVAKFGLSTPSVREVPAKLTTNERISEILAELKTSTAKILILLGDQPIKWFLAHYDSRWERLSDFEPYGTLHTVKIDGMNYSVLPLAHPRQTARLGHSSVEWYNKHSTWIKESAGRVLPR